MTAIVLSSPSHSNKCIITPEPNKIDKRDCIKYYWLLLCDRLCIVAYVNYVEIYLYDY